MCTAITFKTKDFYFGRTLDYECSFGEEIVITQRNFEFNSDGFQEHKGKHYAIIGVAHVAGGFPLYYDAVNEKGLAMAGLNFVGNARYGKEKDHMSNIAQFEILPWILANCADIKEAREALKKANITDRAFSSDLPAAQLHWIIADRRECITVEATEEGMKIYQNEPGVLTNNPTFDKQIFNLNNYMTVTSQMAQNMFSEKLNLSPYCYGMGGMGLPGDWSSMSRFVRAAFAKLNSVCGQSEEESVRCFFHIMETVQQVKGCSRTPDGFEMTIYTSCCNADKGIYYYTTFENHQITAVDMTKENLEGKHLVTYPLITKQQINMQNQDHLS